MMKFSIALTAASAASAAVAAPLPDTPQFPVIAAAPADPLAYRSLVVAGKAAFDAGDYPKAELLLRQATQLYPFDWQNWRYLAHSLRFQGKWREAIPAYAQLVARGGSFIGQGRYWQAVGHVKLGEHDAAIETLRTIILEDHAIDRPGFAHDENFEPLWDDPAFIELVSPPATGKDRVTGWEGDLTHLMLEIQRLDPDYRAQDFRPETWDLIMRLRTDIPSLSDEQIFVRLSEIVGSLHQNHTEFWGAPPPGVQGRKTILPMSYLPLQLYAFPDGTYVVGADAAHKALIGSRVEAVGATPAPRVVEAVKRTISAASEAEMAWSLPDHLQIVPVLQGLGFARPGEPIELTLSRSGTRTKVRLAPVSSPVGGKLGAPAGVVAPLYLTDPDNPHWFKRLDDGRTILAEFRQVADAENETLAQFALKLRQAAADPAIDSIILDMRLNNGGNTFLYTELLRTLVAFSTRPGAQVYVLIGRGVYSAAGNFVTDAERFANPIFVGEPTGNMGNQDGDEGRVVLPYSGLYATIAAVKWQLSNPWDVRRSIVPHVPVTPTAADYFAGRDPVLDATMKLIAGRHQP